VLIVLVALALAVSLVERGGDRVPSREPVSIMLAGLAIVAVLSGLVNDSLRQALPTIALLAVLWAAFVVAQRAGGDGCEPLVGAVILVGVLTAVAGVVGVVFRRHPLSLVDEDLWRAASTLTYSNATAGFLLLPTLVALGRTVRRSRGLVWPLAAWVMVVGILATLSRGGILALAFGFLALLTLEGLRDVLVRTWPVLVGAGIGIVGILPAMPDRLPSRPALAAGTLAAGAAVVVLAAHGRRLALTAALAGAGAAALLGAAQLDLQRDITAVRGNAASPARLDGWAAAMDLYADNAILGTGPGNATYAYVNDQGEPLVTLFVHNEYLQLMTEMGAAGILVLGLGISYTARALLRQRSRLRNANLVGIAAGAAALAVHSAVDFLWHIPVVPLTAGILLGVVSSTNE
jgi:hypothetical protein